MEYERINLGLRNCATDDELSDGTTESISIVSSEGSSERKSPIKFSDFADGQREEAKDEFPTGQQAAALRPPRGVPATRRLSRGGRGYRGIGESWYPENKRSRQEGLSRRQIAAQKSKREGYGRGAAQWAVKKKNNNEDNERKGEVEASGSWYDFDNFNQKEKDPFKKEPLVSEEVLDANISEGKNKRIIADAYCNTRWYVPPHARKAISDSNNGQPATVTGSTREKENVSATAYKRSNGPVEGKNFYRNRWEDNLTWRNSETVNEVKENQIRHREQIKDKLIKAKFPTESSDPTTNTEDSVNLDIEKIEAIKDKMKHKRIMFEKIYGIVPKPPPPVSNLNPEAKPFVPPSKRTQNFSSSLSTLNPDI